MFKKLLMNVLMRLVEAIEGMTFAIEALMELDCNHLKHLVVKYRQRKDVIYCSKEFNIHKCLLKILDMDLVQSNSHVIIVTIPTVSQLLTV